ncbi:hypothetical protein EV182_002322 [Spiromyces aspiralis]|uniref:Uncharacterized protein n=1 Tax=Spiromyces aspiralis TaxID=68401 RepID=A0ACC1HRX9_9FUNG|nr:hypothetical protein EV182_002322 [Spiromyces aspiralis]
MPAEMHSLAQNNSKLTQPTMSAVNGKDNRKAKRRKKKNNNRIKLNLNQEPPKRDTYEDGSDIEIEYVPETIFLDDNLHEEFSNVFEHFNTIGTNEEDEAEDDEQQMMLTDSDDQASDLDIYSDSRTKPITSKKKLKQVLRMDVAELKKQVKRPEVIDWVDVTASDPKLLITLKSVKNSVSVPQHWSQKRKYLQNKRGIEKPPFKLPAFIRDTGIMEMRDSAKEREEQQTAKAKQRARVQPKMNRLTIDYKRLHDAFFRFQTPPENLAGHGELYYEGKEFESDVKHTQPGKISEELREALGIPPLAPPPWLINMQRYGMPPSYPHLIIPGLNAPIPPGAQWGFHPGGWGHPPVGEFGRPLYGDVFGVAQQPDGAATYQDAQGQVEHTLWGELESASEEEEEEEEDEEGEGKEEEEIEGRATALEGSEVEQQPALAGEQLPDGLVTPGGLASVPAGLETPDVIQLRKEKAPAPVEERRDLYQVIPERQAQIQGFMGSQYVYDLSVAKSGKEGGAPAAGSPEISNHDQAASQEVQQGESVAVAIEHASAEDAERQARKRKQQQHSAETEARATSNAPSREKKRREFKF